MIMSNDEKIIISGSEAKIFLDLLQIFEKLHKKIKPMLRNNSPQILTEYTKALNTCLKLAPEVIKELEKWSDNNNDR